MRRVSLGLRCKAEAGAFPVAVSLRQLKVNEASMGFDVVLRTKSWGCSMVPIGNASAGSGLEERAWERGGSTGQFQRNRAP
jgi:hypothetical protein